MFELEHIVEPLLAWFYGHARVLPWREEPTPYRVWISEIMLQQTRVEAVKPYFERFMKALPDVAALAAVEEDKLLKLWEGLGYYNRARNLKKAAIIIQEKYQGELPSEVSPLMQLPGIGSYTAGAIASIAYQEPYPAVDGNVLRVISRVVEDYQDVLNQKVKKQYEDSLLKIMPTDCPGAFNQALMELGAVVCLPNGAPKCQECPWKSFCIARAKNCMLDLPHKAKKKKRIIEEKTVLLIQDEKKAAIRKRPDKGLLAGLYEFPMLDGFKTQKDVIQYVSELGFKSIHVKELPPSKHIFTHKEWHMIGYAVRVDELDRPGQNADLKGFEFIETRKTEESYPIPAAFAAYTQYLNIKLGNNKYKENQE